jgi:hypothetical protein
MLPDFEAWGRLRARSLETHVLADAETETEGEGVAIARRESRSGLPAKPEPGGRYRNITVEKKVIGEMNGEWPGADARPPSATPKAGG